MQPANILNFQKIYAPALARVENGRLVPDWGHTVRRASAPDS